MLPLEDLPTNKLIVFSGSNLESILFHLIEYVLNFNDFLTGEHYSSHIPFKLTLAKNPPLNIQPLAN